MNLDTYEVDRVNEHDHFDTFSVTIGESQEDEELNVYYRTHDFGILNLVSDDNLEIDEIQIFDLHKNYGIQPDLANDLWIENKYFFKTSDGIFVTKEDTTYRIADLKYNVRSSPLRQYQDHIFIMAEVENDPYTSNDSVYIYKINIHDLSYESKLLEDVTKVSSQSIPISNLIVNPSYGLLEYQSSGFYNMESEEYIHFKELNLPSGDVVSVSGNSILYKTNTQQGSEWLLYNPITDEILLTEIEPGSSPIVTADGNGGFYLEKGEINKTISFLHVNEQGKLSVIMEELDASAAKRRIGSSLKSFLFNQDNELILFSFKDGEMTQNTIPEPFTGDANFYWYQSDQVSYFDFFNGETRKTYRITFGNEPELITPNDRDEKLETVMEGESFDILVYSNGGILSFEKFDPANSTLEFIFEESFQYNGQHYQIAPDQYILSLNDNINGYEPWVYKLATNELQLIEDMLPGPISSNIRDFTTNPINGEIFFTALTNNINRQLHKLDEVNISAVVNQYNHSKMLSLFPNPINDYIQLDANLEAYYILSSDGKVVSQSKSQYTAGDKISLIRLSDGMYFLIGSSSNGEQNVSKFVVDR